jgi:Yip1 domain
MSSGAGVPTRSSFAARMWRASLLHADTYEEVEADRRSIGQAATVVLLACAASLLGFWLRLQLGHELPPGALPLPLQLSVIFLEPLVLWGAGSAFAFMVGSSFFRGRHTQTDYAEVLRTMGFAFTPSLLAVFAFVPPDPVGFAVLGASRIWTFVACVVAIRQALDFDTLRAFGTFGFAALLLWLVLWGLSIAPFPS